MWVYRVSWCLLYCLNLFALQFSLSHKATIQYEIVSYLDVFVSLSLIALYINQFNTAAPNSPHQILNLRKKKKQRSHSGS